MPAVKQKLHEPSLHNLIKCLFLSALSMHNSPLFFHILTEYLVSTGLRDPS